MCKHSIFILTKQLKNSIIYICGVYSVLLSNNIDNFNNLSVLSPGYIISPEGNIFTVLDDEDHSDVFERYLTEKYGRRELIGLHQAKQIDVLTNILGNIIYYGIKTSDTKYIYGCNDVNSSVGYFFVPDDMTNLTEQQRQICLKILESNRSVLTGKDKIELHYQSIHSDVGTQEELLSLLTNNVKKNA